jgi:hypothetical protein
MKRCPTVNVVGHRLGVAEPEDERPTQESTEIADGLLIAHGSSAGSTRLADGRTVSAIRTS